MWVMQSLGSSISSTMAVETDIVGEDIYNIEPGHDAWVDGNEPFVGIEFETLKDYAKG